MLAAVLFDWGNTLLRFTWSDELLAAGHRAGLAALGREQEADTFTARFADVLPTLVPGSDYGALMRELLGGATEEEVARFQSAEHDVWAPAHELLPSTHALLESLRRRGLELAVVGNAWPEPGELLRRDVDRLGVGERVDAVVWSTDVGERKPHPAPFLRALELLGVAAADALFVGDRLDEDVRGAAAVGMTTVQALWFRAETSDDEEADYQAFTQMDVLDVVDRIAVRTA